MEATLSHIMTTFQSQGIDALALTKLDVLDGVETLKVALGYEMPSGEVVEVFPDDAAVLETVRPVYTDVPSWSDPTAGLVEEGDLPAEAEDYLQFLEEQLGVPIAVVSTGPRRDETMVRGDSEIAEVLRRILC